MQQMGKKQHTGQVAWKMAALAGTKAANKPREQMISDYTSMWWQSFLSHASYPLMAFSDTQELVIFGTLSYLAKLGNIQKYGQFTDN